MKPETLPGWILCFLLLLPPFPLRCHRVVPSCLQCEGGALGWAAFAVPLVRAGRGLGLGVIDMVVIVVVVVVVVVAAAAGMTLPRHVLTDY
ncbi:hypothetical protein CGRA01v4_09708 [Colletotrichum graminicola]|nr:hypothetical protein CGRA01v4_09708 [Colletotrichum graminicola]